MSVPTRKPAGSPHGAVIGFLTKCLAYWAVALFGLARIPALEEAGIRGTVATLQGVLGLFRVPVQRVGNSLLAGSASVEIVSDCSPHVPYLIFAAVVLAFPATWRQRLIGIVAGAAVIHVFNVIRILALMGVLAWKREWFEFAHVYLWQTGTVLVLFVSFALWIRMLAPKPKPS